MSVAAKVDLKYPVSVGEETITELVFKRPKVKHLREMDAIDGDIAVTEAMIIALSGVSPAVAANIDAVDFAKISEVLAVFFVGIQPTGGK